VVEVGAEKTFLAERENAAPESTAAETSFRSITDGLPHSPSIRSKKSRSIDFFPEA